jgi:hypothetical protein
MDRCAVCLHYLKYYDEKLHCGHQFHYECIEMWYNIQKTCPLCRQYIQIQKKPMNGCYFFFFKYIIGIIILYFIYDYFAKKSKLIVEKTKSNELYYIIFD